MHILSIRLVVYIIYPYTLKYLFAMSLIRHHKSEGETTVTVPDSHRCLLASFRAHTAEVLAENVHSCHVQVVVIFHVWVQMLMAVLYLF